MASKVCIMGLGNPGPRYSGTRHNIGFEWVDSLAAQLGESSWKEKYESLWLQSNFMGFELHLMKPQTFMNESGRAYAQWKTKNQGDHRILVVYDDLDLPVGRLRLRYKGSDGGQRGMKSVIEHFGSNEVPRLRIGIGRNGEEASDYVLSRFTPDQWSHIKPLVQDARKHLELFLNHESEKAMNLVNSLQYGEK